MRLGSVGVCVGLFSCTAPQCPTPLPPTPPAQSRPAQACPEPARCPSPSPASNQEALHAALRGTQFCQFEETGVSVQSLVTLHDVRFSSSGPLLTVTWLVHLLCSYETMECKFFIFWLDNEEQDGTVRPINALISSFDDPLLEIVSHGPTAITLQHKGARETFTVDLKEGTFRYLNPREGMRGDGECVNRRNPMLPEGTF